MFPPKTIEPAARKPRLPPHANWHTANTLACLLACLHARPLHPQPTGPPADEQVNFKRIKESAIDRTSHQAQTQDKFPSGHTYQSVPLAFGRVCFTFSSQPPPICTPFRSARSLVPVVCDQHQQRSAVVFTTLYPNSSLAEGSEGDEWFTPDKMALKMHRFPSQMAREIGSFLSPEDLAHCTKQLCSKGVTFVEAPEPAPTVARMDLCELINLCRSRSSGKRESSTAKPDARAAAIVAHEVFGRIQLYLTQCPNIKQLDLQVDERYEFANMVPIFRLVEQHMNTTQAVLLVAVRWHVHTSTLDAALAYRPLHALTLSGGNQVKDVAGLASCESLDYLSLWRCWSVVDVSALGACQSLRTLNLGETLVHDVSALAKCEKLYALSLHCTKVTDVSALSACQSLRILDLATTGVTDLSPLLACKTLGILNLVNSHLYASPKQQLRAYPPKTRAVLDTINSREPWSTSSDLCTAFR
jgi:hypothetical protein